MMKLTLTLVSLAALASACNFHTTRVEREARWALADYHATEAEHLRSNYYAHAKRDMTCMVHTPRGPVGLPSYDFEAACRPFPMGSH